ncbi:hypothetical protein BC443_10565 [Salinicola sp. MIT1003]|nr:hypothetical protein BC443_10565 [Salinicola sp. MIT1003]
MAQLQWIGSGRYTIPIRESDFPDGWFGARPSIRKWHPAQMSAVFRDALTASGIARRQKASLMTVSDQRLAS